MSGWLERMIICLFTDGRTHSHTHTLPQTCVQYLCDSHTPESGKKKHVWTEGKHSHKTHHNSNSLTDGAEAKQLAKVWLSDSEQLYTHIHVRDDPIRPSFVCLHTHTSDKISEGWKKGELSIQRNNHNSTSSAFQALSAPRGPWS